MTSMILVLIHMFFNQPYNIVVQDDNDPGLIAFCQADENCMDIQNFDDLPVRLDSITMEYKGKTKTVFIDDNRFIEVTPTGEMFFCEKKSTFTSCKNEHQMKGAL